MIIALLRYVYIDYKELDRCIGQYPDPSSSIGHMY
jgi:hypothetical protein